MIVADDDFEPALTGVDGAYNQLRRLQDIKKLFKLDANDEKCRAYDGIPFVQLETLSTETTVDEQNILTFDGYLLFCEMGSTQKTYVPIGLKKRVVATQQENGETVKSPRPDSASTGTGSSRETSVIAARSSPHLASGDLTKLPSPSSRKSVTFNENVNSEGIIIGVDYPEPTCRNENDKGYNLQGLELNSDFCSGDYLALKRYETRHVTVDNRVNGWKIILNDLGVHMAVLPEDKISGNINSGMKYVVLCLCNDTQRYGLYVDDNGNHVHESESKIKSIIDMDCKQKANMNDLAYSVEIQNSGENAIKLIKFFTKFSVCSWAHALFGMLNETDFAIFFCEVLTREGSMFQNGYFFEASPIPPSDKLYEAQFACALIGANTAFKKTSPEDFNEYLNVDACKAVTFTSLSGNTLVAPCPEISSGVMKDYGHIAKFMENAPLDQQLALWKEAAKTIYGSVNRDTCLWLSTDGTWVPWLHLRIEKQPNHFKHDDFKKSYVPMPVYDTTTNEDDDERRRRR